ncbi:protein MAIN-LIKE 1-like [Glycine max]|uniref:protein MAIN-LIKE 1-like n=1 Tax=Glycine max TaxID=3847 RepID=UPI0003DEBB56|nr:protein MAIN-LIKE 1-like [Glycine max]|eukprot:XP_006598555.1 protein MAIN-LIKE 1-like [Glycine max]
MNIGPPFGGGPIDLSLIRSYRDQYVGHVWIRQSRPKMKLVIHDGQVLPLLTESTVKAYVLRSGLSTLVTMWYPATNKGFVNTHVERCHQEISSFHLPVGNITITLDYVLRFLLLLVTGILIDHVPSTFSRGREDFVHDSPWH